MSVSRRFSPRPVCALAVVVSVIGFSAQPASSQDFDWTGFSVYGAVGGGKFDGDVAITDATRYEAAIECDPVPNQGFLGITFCVPLGPIGTTPTNNAVGDLDGDGGILGAVGVAGDFEPIRGIVIGAFADIEFSNSDINFNTISTTDLGPFGFVQAGTTVAGQMEHEYSFTFGGRLGILSLDRQALFYVLGGYTEVHFDNPTAQVTNFLEGPFGGTISANPINVALPDSYRGATVGLGTEVKLTSILSIKLEGRYTNLQSETVSYSGDTTVRHSLGFTEFGPGCNGSPDCEKILRASARSNGSISIDPEVWSGRIALTFKLN